MAGVCVLLWAIADFLETADHFDPEQEESEFYLIQTSPKIPSTWLQIGSKISFSLFL